jgi:ankyrin repeat protein
MGAKNRFGYTPLHFAADRGHIEIVRLLCDHGADIEARDYDECRPLHEAAYHGHISVVNT